MLINWARRMKKKRRLLLVLGVLSLRICVSCITHIGEFGSLSNAKTQSKPIPVSVSRPTRSY